jgi:protein-arginine kinase
MQDLFLFIFRVNRDYEILTNEGFFRINECSYRLFEFRLEVEVNYFAVVYKLRETELFSNVQQVIIKIVFASNLT